MVNQWFINLIPSSYHSEAYNYSSVFIDVLKISDFTSINLFKER